MSASVPPAPSLEHLKKSANFIWLMKDRTIIFMASPPPESPMSKEDRMSFLHQPISLEEHLLPGPSESDGSELVASVFASLQQMRTGGNESDHLFDLQLFEEEKQYSLWLKLNESFVRKMRGVLLAPFLTLQGTLYADSDPRNRYVFFGQTELELLADDAGDSRWVKIEAFRKGLVLSPANIKVCVEGKLNSVTLGWREPDGVGMKLSTDSLLQNVFPESSKDLTIVAANGVEFKCHRGIFEAQSPVLAAMISPDNGMKEGQTGRVEMKENSEEGVRQLLRYLYCVEVDTSKLNCEVALELFKTAHKYELNYLETCMRELLLRKGKEWYEPNVIMELYYHVRNKKEWAKLRDHSLRVMTRMPSQIRSCDRFKELSREDGKEAQNLVWKLFDFKGTD